ncbi:hypothetical protein ONS95_004101 [Cadophora gregata]|uniref:uncharacterized protein n=1 Tax=Cadophora gregata TaxID=51156 RepID=UPI0026DA8EB8|nr:uncharacterized protein ONS95_004101 [Cadophora gregata]KAK0105541.1 hypothetical protein ONS96_004925 [Cadophora gregata f. sp. sojae]KAK0105569.1 hypothetical protein ONS95_004101 [Cadophora gregata]
MTSSEMPPGPKIKQWFIDTRPLWPVPKQAKSQDEVAALRTVASKELSLLSEAEQKSVLRYYHIRDAKTKLASHLLKHFAITKYGGVTWSESSISRGEKGKPFFIPPNNPPPPSSQDLNVSTTTPTAATRLDFNVSHQAGIVSLIAAIGHSSPIDVGTDVVCVNERQKMDYSSIDRDGFFAWVDMHGDVFASTELSEMRLKPVPVDLRVRGAKLSGYGMDAISRCQWRGKVLSVKAVGRDGEDLEVRVESERVVEGKVRRFYAWWCVREAYVKMTGEGFAATWLKELEILGVEAPEPGVGVVEGEGEGEGEGDLWEGEVKREFRMAFEGREVKDVKLELTALGEQYMIAGAVRVPQGVESVKMGSWVQLDLKDILQLAESSNR